MQDDLRNEDFEVFKIIQAEAKRQQNTIELIASENIVSRAVLEATGSVLTNKYAEGYPGHRYYNGCEEVDKVETLAIERAKQLFHCDYANVQPHSGSQANMGVYFALLRPDDTILGMSLNEGGHLTHGSPVNFSGKDYQVSSYGVNKETGLLDYDEVEKIAQKEKPKLIIAGASAYPRIIDFKRFREIADRTGSVLVADMAHIAGLVATKLHPSPLPHAHVVTTTTHKTLRGPRGGMILVGKDVPAPLFAQVGKKEKTLGQIFNSGIFPGIQGGPLMHIIAGKAVALREALTPEFLIYQKQVLLNAQALAWSLLQENISLVSGGTDNHLLILNVSKENLTGKEVSEWFEQAGLTTNKNTIPFDKYSPSKTSGVRIGTPAATSRGMQEEQMKQIGLWMARIIRAKGSSQEISRIRKKTEDLCQAFPLPF